MSLMKWTLAMAGAAMGVRYMSNRHRQRLAGQQDGSMDDSSSSMGSRAAQDDRDSPSQWSTGSGGMGDMPASSSSGLSASSATGIGGGSVGGLGGNAGLGGGSSMSDSGPGTTARSDDLLSPDSDSTPGGSGSRY